MLYYALMPEVLEDIALSQAVSEKKPDSLSKDTEKVPESHDSLKSIHFKLPVFEGPLDLLIHLIKENKIDIYDIPIMEITRQYISYLELMKDLNLEIAGEFLVMAATLIHIKSRMLLPPDEEEKEEQIEDPRAELVHRLLEYQAFKESSVQLRQREELWKHIFWRNSPEDTEFEFEEEPVLFEASVYDLISAFRKLLEKAPEQAFEITRESLTVTDKINHIVELIDKEDSIRFESLFEEGFSRLTLIVTFLALLETVRLGLVKIFQEKSFGAIWLINPRKQETATSEEIVQDILSPQSGQDQKLS